MKSKQLFGTFLAILGTIIAVGVSLYFVREESSLYGLIATVMIAFMMYGWNPDEHNWAPMAIGFSILVIGCLVAAAVYLLMSNTALIGLVACVLVAGAGTTKK